jgi:hypothetical protein
MEYMDAGTLQQFVHDKRQADEETLAAIARAVLKVLLYFTYSIHTYILATWHYFHVPAAVSM